MNIFTQFIDLVKALEKNFAEYMLVGGMAVNFHGYNRNTGDIDIFINPTIENLERVKKSLHEVFSDKSIDEITHEDLKKYSVIRYGTPNDFYIDIIGSIGEAYSFADLSYDIFEISSIKIKVADAKTLIKLKSKTYQEID